MRQQEVGLYIRIRTTNGKQSYCRPVWLNKRELKDGWAFVAGKPEHRPEGVYHLRYTVNGKRVWEKVGKDSHKALQAWANRKWILNNTDTTTRVGATFWAEHQPSVAAPNKLTLQDWQEKFLELKRTTTKKDGTPLDDETITAYKRQLTEFLSICKAEVAEEITGQDLRNYMAALRKRGLMHWSVCNNYTSIATFLKFIGVDHKTLLPYGERPAPDEGTPESYSEEEISRFFNALTDERHRLFFEFLLKVGPREREATTLEWTDLKLDKGAKVTIQARKPHLNFRVKTGKGRVVPLERNLVLKLSAWRAANPTTKLVFGTSSDREDSHFYRVCVETAEKAGMKRESFCLHKWRDTAATNWLRNGVDLRTVSAWLGHSSITMTEKYLAPQTGERAEALMNQVYATDVVQREVTAAVQ